MTSYALPAEQGLACSVVTVETALLSAYLKPKSITPVSPQQIRNGSLVIHS